MRILGVALDQIDARFLEKLAADRTPESDTHDYKRQIPHAKDEEGKGRFLVSASAFANARGGVLVVGLDSESDQAEWSVPGIDDPDNTTIQQRLRSGIDPPIPGVQIRSISLPGGRSVLLLGIPRSLMAPHAARDKGARWFWRRTGDANVQLTVEQLRAAFSEAGSWIRSAEEFHRNRVASVRSGLRIQLLDVRTSFFVHVLPLGRLDTFYDLADISDSLVKAIHAFGRWGTNPLFNADGYFMPHHHDRRITAYTQWFRFGGVEGYGSYPYIDATPSPREAARVDAPPDQRRYLRASMIQRDLEAYVPPALAAMRDVFKLDPPYIILMSLYGVRGTLIPTRWGGDDGQLVDVDELLLPPVLLEDADAAGAQARLKPVLDVIWQAGGHPRAVPAE